MGSFKKRGTPCTTIEDMTPNDLSPKPTPASAPRSRGVLRMFTLRRMATVSGFAALLLVLAWAWLLRGLREAIPPPTGQIPIGRSTFYWRDPERPRNSTPASNDDDELRVDVWYPAEPADDAKPAAYCADFDALRGQLGLERLVVGNVRTHATVDPPVHGDSERYPLIVLSPGHGMNATWYTALIEDLVSHGYIVAAVDHPFQSKAIAYADGRVVSVVETDPKLAMDPSAFEQSYRERVDRRAEDLAFVLNQLQSLDSGEGTNRFVGRFDLEKVGVIGHSIGGVAAAAAAQRDPRFKAIVNLDGHLLGLPFAADELGKGPAQPLLELTDGSPPPTDEQLAEWKTTRADFDKAQERIDGAMRSGAGGSIRVSLDGTTHETFSDNALWLPTARDDRRHHMELVRSYVREFFDSSLRGKSSSLLAAETPPPQGVKVEIFTPAE